MSGTPATVALRGAGVAYSLHRYDYDPRADKVGLQAAQALGEPPARVLKTLMLLVDAKPVCAIVPSDRELALKQVAAAFNGKAAQMMAATAAEKLTGYRVGGISPFGQRRRVPTVLDQSALDEPYVFVNGGQRGLQLRLGPDDLCRLLGAGVAPLLA